MQQADLAALRERLIDMKAALEAQGEYAGDATATVVLDQSSVGRLSRMDALQGQQMALESERRRKARLVQIGVALIRIEKEEFGICAVCGEDISPGRLDVDPAATRCISCAE